MSEKFTIEIISPDKTVIKTEAVEVTIPSYEGEMGILKNHIPLITFLRPGFVKIKNGSEQIFFVEDVKKNIETSVEIFIHTKENIQKIKDSMPKVGQLNGATRVHEVVFEKDGKMMMKKTSCQLS